MVGLALGLAANTFTNINSRLLLEIDKTTVQTLVLHRRADFRLDIAAARFNNRPAVIHALRQYLNICTPFAIETDINSTVTVFQQGGAAAIDRRGPLITPATVNAAVRAGTIANVREVPIVPFRPKGVDTAKLFFTQVQDALCVADRSGALNPATEAAIRDYLVGVREISAGATTPVGISPRVRILLNRALDEVPSCQQMGFMSAFEVGRYGIGTAAARRAAIESLQEGLRSQLKIAAGDLNSGELDAKTRQAVVRFRTEKSLRPALGGRIDAELLARVRE